MHVYGCCINIYTYAFVWGTSAPHIFLFRVKQWCWNGNVQVCVSVLLAVRRCVLASDSACMCIYVRGCTCPLQSPARSKLSSTISTPSVWIQCELSLQWCTHIVVTDNNVKRAYIYIITSDYFLTPAERGFKKCKVICQMVYITLQSYSLNMQIIMHTDYRWRFFLGMVKARVCNRLWHKT